MVNCSGLMVENESPSSAWDQQPYKNCEIKLLKMVGFLTFVNANSNFGVMLRFGY